MERSTSRLSPQSTINLQHKLLKVHFYKASKYSGNAKTLSQIRAVLEDTMRNRMRIGKCSVRELWGRSTIARSCGGYVNKIIEAILHEPLVTHSPQLNVVTCSRKWGLEYREKILKNGNQIEDAVFLVLKDFVEPEWEANKDDLSDYMESEEASAVEKGVGGMRIVGKTEPAHSSKVVEAGDQTAGSQPITWSSLSRGDPSDSSWNKWGDGDTNSAAPVKSSQGVNNDGWD